MVFAFPVVVAVSSGTGSTQTALAAAEARKVRRAGDNGVEDIAILLVWKSESWHIAAPHMLAEIRSTVGMQSRRIVLPEKWE